MKSLNITSYLVLFLSVLLFSNFQCSDCDETINGRVDYSTEIQPLLPIYNVGDTIFLRTELNSMFQIDNSSRIYDNSNLPMSILFNLFEGLQNTEDVIPAQDKFELLQGDGDITTRDNRQFQVQVINDCGFENCELSIGLIPLQSGYYGLDLDSGWANLEDCVSILLRPEEFLTNQNNNFEIFEEINIPFVRIDGSVFINDQLENPQLYFFRVDE